MQQQIDTINVDGVQHKLTDLPEDVQKAIALYQKFLLDQESLQQDLFKTQLAIEGLTGKIAEAVKASITKAPPAEVPTTEG